MCLSCQTVHNGTRPADHVHDADTESRRAPTQFPFGTLTADAGRSADPVLVEIVQGPREPSSTRWRPPSARTSRSPMIRDAHDFRAGIHDRLLRKLTGRSYSALVHPVARDFRSRRCRRATSSSTTTSTSPRAASATCPTSASRSPCSPVRGERRVVAFIQAFGHHDDIGGAVPGSMPSHATSVFEEGLAVPHQAVGRRQAQPRGADDHDPQLADARVAGRRPRRGSARPA